MIHSETQREGERGRRTEAETHTFRNRVIHRETERERGRRTERDTHIQKQCDT